MYIALFPNEEKNQSFEIARNIQKFLKSNHILSVAEDEKAEKLHAIPLSSIPPDEIKFIITLGGDGTLLRLFHKYPHLKAPVLGINLGFLGFMADIPLADLYPSLTELINGSYTIEKRLKLECLSDTKSHFFAANDIVFHRAQNHSLIELSLSIDGSYFNTFLSDGMIFATPNGSTAYSLAAGGPILSPKLDAIVITPICPHTISNRPIVLTSEHTITIEYLSDYTHPIEVWADGFECIFLSQKQRLTIKKQNETFSLVKLHRHNYFSTLRSKLGWSGKIY